MVLCLVRCCRFQTVTGLQKTVRKQCLRSLLSCESKPDTSRMIFHHTRMVNSGIHHNRLEPDYSRIGRPFHSSSFLLKKFKEEDYKIVRILDPSGQYICSAELHVLKKFCHRYKRFDFVEVKPDSEKASNVAEGDGRLQIFQLSDRLEGKLEGSKDTRTKMIKYHREANVKTEKLDRLMEVLVDEGKVTVTFDEKSKVGKDVLKVLQEFKNIKVAVSTDNKVLVVKLDEISLDLLQKLFEDVQMKEAEHVAQVKEMLKTMKEQ